MLFYFIYHYFFYSFYFKIMLILYNVCYGYDYEILNKPINFMGIIFFLLITIKEIMGK